MTTMKTKLLQLQTALTARILPAHVRAQFFRALLGCLSGMNA
jgi:hypothetical protein